MSTVHEIEPYREMQVPDTALTVYHQGSEEGYVHVHEDGRVELRGPWDWTVKVGAEGRLSRRRELDWLEAVGDLPIRFWACPVEGHSDRGRLGSGDALVVTGEWRGDVAHCTAPGCGRTSDDPAHDTSPCCPEFARTGYAHTEPCCSLDG